MSLRMIVSMAALVIIGIATVPTDASAVPAGTTRLHHHHYYHHCDYYHHCYRHAVHHSGAVRY